MGLLDFLPTDNPFLNGVREFGIQQRPFFQDMGYGLMKGKNFSDGLKEGAKRSETMAPLRAQEAIRMQEMQQAADEKNQTMEWLQANYPQYAGLPPAEGFQAAMRDMAQQKQGGIAQDAAARTALADAQGLHGDVRQQFILTGELPGSNQSVRAGMGQPIPVKNTVTGETGAAMPMSDGSYMNPFTQQPFGPEWSFDPAWVASQRAAGTVAGRETTEAAVTLAPTIDAAEQGLANLEGLLPELDANGNPIAGTNKGFDEQFGVIGINGIGLPQQWTGALGGSEKAGYQGRIRQVQSQAFLTAITQLKGLGALSDAEGQTATKAITRISENLPQKEYIAAVKELMDVVKLGIQRAKEKAALSPVAGGLGAGGAPAPAAGGGGYTVLGVE